RVFETDFRAGLAAGQVVMVVTYGRIELELLAERRVDLEITRGDPLSPGRKVVTEVRHRLQTALHLLRCQGVLVAHEVISAKGRGQSATRQGQQFARGSKVCKGELGGIRRFQVWRHERVQCRTVGLPDQERIRRTVQRRL